MAKNGDTNQCHVRYHGKWVTRKEKTKMKRHKRGE